MDILRLSRFTALLLLLTLIVPTGLFRAAYNAEATDLLPVVYVNGSTGSDSNYGDAPVYTSDHHGPKQTIANGIGAVALDGTVYVAAGAYYEHSLDLHATMNLVGEGALTTFIDGGRLGYVLKVSSAPSQRNIISGFTIRNGAGGGSESGGGIYISKEHIVTINDCAIINNGKEIGEDKQPGKGGGVCNDGGVLYMERCTVSGNSASDAGGGICTIKDPLFGGDTGMAVLTDCTISGNTVTESNGQGGGIWNSGTLTMNRCCISGNHASKGNGIHTMTDASATLINCTISRNTGIGPGGGIRNWGIMHCYNITITENSGSVGGGFSNDGVTAKMYFLNCIVSGNTATSAGNNGYDTNAGGGVESEGYNIDSEDSCYFHESTDKINTDPLLGALQNNGGPTSTYAITSASPAYNAGTAIGAPPTDQRGVARPQVGLFDIGAFELMPIAPTVATVAAGGIGTTTAILNGNLTYNGTASLVNLSFEYGLTTLYGSTTAGVPPATSTAPQAFGALISGLTPGTIYHFHAKANGGEHGSSSGADMTFTTVTPPPPPPSPPPPGPQYTGIGTGNPGGSSGSMSSSISTMQPVVNPTIIIQSASISRSQNYGDPVIISAIVANTSTVSGTTKVRLYVNGQLEAEKGVTVASGRQAPVSFQVSRSEPGTYQVYVNGTPVGSFIVEAVKASDVLLYFSITFILISMVLGVVYLGRRRAY